MLNRTLQIEIDDFVERVMQEEILKNNLFISEEINNFMIIAGGFVLGSVFTIIILIINFLISKLIHRRYKF